MQTDLTPSQIIWSKFYTVLHEEVLRLQALAEKNTAVSVIVSQDQAEATVKQSQLIKASESDSTQYGQK